MMTEDEAKTKWCPAYRFSAAISPAGDRDGCDNRRSEDKPETQAKCIGSACMAWRWSARNTVGMRDSAKRGHCGLAEAAQ